MGKKKSLKAAAGRVPRKEPYCDRRLGAVIERVKEQATRLATLAKRWTRRARRRRDRRARDAHPRPEPDRQLHRQRQPGRARSEECEGRVCDIGHPCKLDQFLVPECEQVGN